MHVLGAIAFIAFCVINMAFDIDTPKVMELKKDINYAKIKQAFPNMSDADLISRRIKLESLNNKVISSIPKNSAPVKVTKNPKYDNLPGTPRDISIINKLLAPYLYQMDIVLTNQQLNEVVASARKKRKALSDPSYKWPTKANGVIPYFFAANLTAEKITVIQAAIKFWEDNACLKFELNGAGSNSLLIFNGPGCYSYLGMTDGQQPFSIGDGCENLGTVTHELGHALGFYHEQSRYDRDSYVTVNLANVEAGMEGQFDKATPAEMNLYNVPYDYGSVMHYSSDAFAIDSSIPVLIAADPRYNQIMGQRGGPSFLDVLTMNRHYGCDALCASFTTVCQNGGYMDPNNCNQCKCPVSFGGTFCETVAPAENGACGASLAATIAWQSFSATVGTKNTTDIPTTCYWHIDSPPGTTIEVNVTYIGGSCNPGCYWNYIDILLDNDYTKTGIRHCCPADLPSTPYVTTTNKVPIIVYGSYEIPFVIQYRYVDASTTTTTTTSTTSTPTTTTDDSATTTTTPTTTSTTTTLTTSTTMPTTTTSSTPTTTSTTTTPTTTATSTTATPITTSTTTTPTTTSTAATTTSTTSTTTKTTEKPTTTSTTLTTTTTTKKPTTTTTTTKKPTTSTTTTTTKKPTTTSTIASTTTSTKKTTTSTTNAPTTTAAPSSACSVMDVDPNVRLSSKPRNYKVYGKVNDCAAKCAAETNFTCKGFVWKGPNSGCVLHGKLDLPVVMQNASKWFLVDLDCKASQPCWWSVNAMNIDPTSIGASKKPVNVKNHHQCQALCLLGVLQPKCRAFALTDDPFYADGYNCYLFPALKQNQINSAVSGKFVLYHNQCF